jgi:hypothetical protein
MDDALVAYNAGRVDGSAGYRDPQIAEDAEVGADYRIGLLDGRIAAFQLIMEVRRILGVEGSLFERPDDVPGGGDDRILSRRHQLMINSSQQQPTAK